MLPGRALTLNLIQLGNQRRPELHLVSDDPDHPGEVVHDDQAARDRGVELGQGLCDLIPGGKISIKATCVSPTTSHLIKQTLSDYSASVSPTPP